MATTNALAAQGTVSFPPDEGQAAVPVQFGLTTTYQSVSDSRLVMTGPGTTAVPFGTVGTPGAKLLLVELEAVQGAAAVTLKFNASSDGIELSPGGFILYASPTPAVGITSLSIVRTGDAVVRVRSFG